MDKKVTPRKAELYNILSNLHKSREEIRKAPTQAREIGAIFTFFNNLKDPKNTKGKLHAAYKMIDALKDDIDASIKRFEKELAVLIKNKTT